MKEKREKKKNRWQFEWSVFVFRFPSTPCQVLYSVSNFAFGEGFSNLSNPTHKHLSLYPLRLKVLDFQL